MNLQSPANLLSDQIYALAQSCADLLISLQISADCSDLRKSVQICEDLCRSPWICADLRGSVQIYADLLGELLPGRSTFSSNLLSECLLYVSDIYIYIYVYIHIYIYILYIYIYIYIYTTGGKYPDLDGLS